MKYFCLFFLIISFNSQTLLSQNVCPGIVTEKNILGDKFWGKCLDGNKPYLGIIELSADGNKGDTFTGYFTEDGTTWDFGKYNFVNEEYYLGKWEEGKKDGKNFDFIGSYYWPTGEGIIGYQKDGFLNGFGMWIYGENKNSANATYKYDIGDFSNGQLNGIGYRVFEVDGEEFSYFGYTNDGDFVGNIYVEQDEEIYLLTGNSYKRIEDYSEYNRLSGYLDKMSTELNEIIDSYDENYSKIENQIVSFFEEEGSGIGNSITNSKFDSTLIKATQNLLANLNFDLGEIDGYLGPLTISAIKAFQIETGLEATGIPSDSLLTKLQSVLRNERNARDENNQESLVEKKLNGKELILKSSGSGFFISNEHLATNYHVVKNCDLLRLDEDKLELVASDRINDIALLKSSNPTKEFLYLSQNPELGEEIFAGGFPLASSYLESFIFSKGTINSLIGLNQNVSEFQFSAPIQPGNSGGPIINSKGSAVGIIVASADEDYVKDASGSLPQLINFGIKIELLKTLLVQNDLNFSVGNYFWFDKDQKELAKLAKNVSRKINCFIEE
jgi:hypothetical protein